MFRKMHFVESSMNPDLDQNDLPTLSEIVMPSGNMNSDFAPSHQD